MSVIILPTAYLGPISYYQLLINAPVVIEQHASYVKQTYANRCHIATANGIESLTIPVEHNTGKVTIRDVKISDHSNWQTLHWRAIETAYNSTPFFDYYKEDLQSFFEQKFTFLLDFNLQIQSTILDLLGFDATITLSESYKKAYQSDEIDLREVLHPKKKEVSLGVQFEHQNYYQVFNHKFGFLPDLSIIDLLFNMGNESRLILKNIKNANN
ncbi:MAG TPA: WbqC family protein [Paludibacteraceae bacterium]|nr:WbqC family protein [Paludibacteraceae bacterium]